MEFYFELSPSEALNSNSMPKNPYVKSGRVSKIRSIAQELGLEKHHNKVFCRKSLDNANERARVKATKSRIRKALNKTESDKKEIEEELSKVKLELDEVEPDYVFKKFKVEVIVYGATRALLDPPNFYPTIKAFIDGLTDAGYWEDDNFNFMEEMSFRYGGKNEKSKKNGFRVIISKS